MRSLAPFSIFSILLAGCAFPASDNSATSISSSHGSPLDVTLTDKDMSNSEGVLLKLRTTTNATIHYDYAEDWPTDSPSSRCSMILGPQASGLFGAPGAGRITIYASDAGSAPVIDKFASLTHGFSLGGKMFALGNETYIGLAFNHSMAGATAKIRFWASSGSAQVVARTKVQFTCVSELISFKGGRLAVTPAATWGNNLTRSFDVSGQGFGWVMVDSDTQATYSLRSENRMWVQSNKAGRDSSESHELLLAPGHYDFDIQSIVGTPRADAALAVIDVPEDVIQTWYTRAALK